MRIRDVVSTEAVRISPGQTLREAARLLGSSQVSDLAVVDAEGRLLGVLSEGDLLRALMPRFDEVVAGCGSLGEAFELFAAGGRDLADQPIDPHVIRDPITVTPEDELLKAATVMVDKQIRRLPVVAGDRLVGTVSRADVCRGVIAAGG